MAKVIIAGLLGLLCFLFLSFAMFNDNPSSEVGGMSYMMLVSGAGIAMCVAALLWLVWKDSRTRK